MSSSTDDLCYVCGAAPGLTRDHVFPRGLFPPPRPGDLLTAPACGDCQKRLQPDEEYFRTLVAAGGYSHDSARALWEGKIKRSFNRRETLRSLFANALRTEDVQSPGGIYLGSLTELEGDRSRIANVLGKIVRGLFFLEAGHPMARDVRWTYEQISPRTAALPDEVMDLLHAIPLQAVGEIVRYKFGLWEAEPRLTITWMAFFARTMFVVSTGPAEVT